MKAAATIIGAVLLAVLAYLLLRGGDVAPVEGETGLSVPSGQEVRFLEFIGLGQGSDGLAVRFRFVAPAISRDGGTVSAEAAQKDMEWLCNNYALERLPSTGPVPAQIVISMADRELPFGTQEPLATQFFEAFRIQDNACIWEAF
ncbi:MAG: acetolactate synthase [Rhodobacteraceae bacterium]|nr:acetolactate synthase [Paracoccaceae bacterium]